MSSPTQALKAFLDEYSKNNVVLWSSFLTYLTVLNVVPFFYFLIFISSHIPFVESKIPTIKSSIIEIVPAYSDELLKYFDMFLNNISHLELINLAIFSISIFSLIGSFFKFANSVYKNKVGILKLVFFFLIALILASVVVSVVIAAKVIMPMFLPELANAVYVKIVPLILWFVFIFTMFLIAKSKNIPYFHIVISAFLTTLFIFFLKMLLGFYFGLFTYSKIYGAVAIIPTILLWLFLFWNILLSGLVLPKVIYRLSALSKKE